MVLKLFCLQEVKTNYIKSKIGVLVIFFFFLIINILNICFIHLIEISQGKLTNNDILVLPMDVTNISKHISLFDTVINHFGKV